MVGVGPLIFFGAQRLSALFGTQNESIQQKHEPMAESLAQAIYGYLLDQTSAFRAQLRKSRRITTPVSPA